ncbi:glycosyltransferase family 4 protein [Nostoc sp. FACHB-280]|uniref:glycosyltransferase family 4 protein n=1 Tax=Nostoc sp. FACHB-280 TaxID=2692839 RepID=UPI00168A495B|nr:glycosyltransferase [Nostoc sp. FACHB-280]MBD2493047.1 glycosyltransferase family 4 protein [Nostoc sp. FACHB-280]
MIISIATGPWLPVPAIQGGSVPRLWQGLAEEFAAKGHQVNILCRAYPGQPQQEVINGVNYIRRGGFSQSTDIRWDLFKDLVYALMTFPRLPPSDILVINDFWLPVFAALRPQVGKIVINANRFPKGQYRLYAKADLITAASQAIKKAITQEYSPAIARTKVIPNPIDINIFHPATSLTYQQQEKVILYVGRLHPEKGVHLLLDAFSLLTQKYAPVKLRIIGPFKESQGGGGEQYLSTLKIKATGLNVEFVEPIFDIQQLAQAYREADIFCYPSLAEKGEAFPVAPLEAMGTGLIPVVSNLDCFQDLINDDETGFFFEHRSTDAASNLSLAWEKIILNPEKAEEMSQKARRKASEFSYQRIASIYLDDFKNLLSNQGVNYLNKKLLS